jgi:hypothetical protein
MLQSNGCINPEHDFDKLKHEKQVLNYFYRTKLKHEE